MGLDSCDSSDLTHQLRRKIATLTAQQGEALRNATFLGMSSSEANEYDERQGQISFLMAELRRLLAPD